MSVWLWSRLCGKKEEKTLTPWNATSIELLEMILNDVEKCNSSEFYGDIAKDLRICLDRLKKEQ